MELVMKNSIHFVLKKNQKICYVYDSNSYYLLSTMTVILLIQLEILKWQDWQKNYIHLSISGGPGVILTGISISLKQKYQMISFNFYAAFNGLLAVGDQIT